MSILRRLVRLEARRQGAAGRAVGITRRDAGSEALPYPVAVCGTGAELDVEEFRARHPRGTLVLVTDYRDAPAGQGR